MSKAWPLVKLGEVLKKSDHWIQLNPQEEYKEVTVRLWGKGVVLRGLVTGSQIAGSRRLQVHSNQFILSRIDARNGAFGLIPEELDNAVVSNDFPVFEIHQDRLLPTYLRWLSKTKDFVESCKSVSEGTTNRVRLKEDKFIQIEIPLPPLAEQRRIVAKIERLAEKVEEAKELRLASTCEVKLFLTSSLKKELSGQRALTHSLQNTAENLLEKQAKKYTKWSSSNSNNAHPNKPLILENGPYKLPNNWVWTTFGSVLTHLIDCVNDTPDFVDYNTGFVGLKSTNIKPYKFDLRERWYVTENDFNSWNRREKPKAGDIILTREAPMGHACRLPNDYKVCLTQRLMLLRSDIEFLLPEFLLHYLNSPPFREQVFNVCRGLTTPHIRVKDAPNFLIPLPPIEQQNLIVFHLDKIKDKMDKLTTIQAQTTAELDALLLSILDKAFKGEL